MESHTHTNTKPNDLWLSKKESTGSFQHKSSIVKGSHPFPSWIHLSSLFSLTSLSLSILCYPLRHVIILSAACRSRNIVRPIVIQFRMEWWAAVKRPTQRERDTHTQICLVMSFNSSNHSERAGRRRLTQSQSLCGWTVSNPATGSVAKGKPSSNHQRARIQPQWGLTASLKVSLQQMTLCLTERHNIRKRQTKPFNYNLTTTRWQTLFISTAWPLCSVEGLKWRPRVHQEKSTAKEIVNETHAGMLVIFRRPRGAAVSCGTLLSREVFNGWLAVSGSCSPPCTEGTVPSIFCPSEKSISTITGASVPLNINHSPSCSGLAANVNWRLTWLRGRGDYISALLSSRAHQTHQRAC